ncbi:MAG TPA: hypothetical protein VHX65_09370 [Pirellulales bacterium]|nr:hypothetical protein [Pirellulales bacterium]
MAIASVADRAASGAAIESSASHLVAEQTAIEAKDSGQLATLAAWCDAHKLPSQAKMVREWLPHREANKLYFFLIPDTFAPPAAITNTAADAPAASDSNVARWWQQFVKLRQTEADALFALAKKALAAHEPALAYELVRETARENPDHPQARIILGYEKYHGHWMSPYAMHRMVTGYAFHEKFGWVPAGDLPRYERGERRYLGGWIDAATDARKHADIKTGWRIETEHYVVTTNSSLEAGVALAGQLERLNEIWRQIFVTYYLPEAELRKRFEATAPVRPATHQLHVVYFADRDQYNATLRPMQPRIGMTLGIYMFDSHTAYFFAGDGQNEQTLFHEATHQLFQEIRPASRDLGRHNNFWIIEAVACYMESLVDHGDYYTAGGFEEGRVPAARQRLLADHFYVPLAELCSIGRDAFQHDPRLPKIYSESSGLAMFLMHDGAGRYRQPLVEYLLAVYAGKSDPDTLSRLTGTKYDKLDEQYFDFMKQSPN